MSIYKNDHGQWAADITLGDGSEKQFEFKKWGAEEATDTYLDLLSVAGGSLAGIANLYASGEGDASDLAGEAMERLARQLAQSVHTHRALAKRLIIKLSSQGILCNGGPVKYDTFYADQLGVSFKVMRANLEVQYGNFFAALGLSGGESLPKATPSLDA